MKVEIEEEKFKPVTLNITLETEQECKDFRVIFNYAPIVNSVNLDDQAIRDALSDYSDSQNFTTFITNLTDSICSNI